MTAPAPPELLTWIEVVHGPLEPETEERMGRVRAAVAAVGPVSSAGRDDRVAWAFRLDAGSTDIVLVLSTILAQREPWWRWSSWVGPIASGARTHPRVAAWFADVNAPAARATDQQE